MRATQTKKSPVLMMLAAGFLAAGALTGCGDDTQEPSNQPIDHQSAHGALQSNAQGAVENLGQALAYLRGNADLGVAQAIDALSAPGETSCSGSFDENGFPAGDEHCTTPEPEPLEDALQEQGDGAIDFLRTYIFVETNIEEETATGVTYLVDGATACAADESASAEQRQSCVEQVDTLQIRLKLTAPAPGDLNIALMIGEQRYRPVDFELHRGQVAAEVDLSALRSALVFGAGVAGDDLPDLPELMQGRVRAEFNHSQNKVAASLAIQEKITVTGNGWLFNADKATPAARLSLDIPTELLSAELNLKPIDLQGPGSTTQYVFSEEHEEAVETTTTFEVLAHLAGASFNANYRIGEERIEVNNLGLGDHTSTLDIDGNRVLEVDLNPEDGRHLGVTVTAGADGGADVALSPGLDLRLLLQFAAVQHKLSDIADWTLDELLRITFTGAETPTLHLEEDDIQVVHGTLTLSSTSQNMSVEVSAGQCLLSPSDESGDDMADDPDAHPLAEMSAGSCSLQ